MKSIVAIVSGNADAVGKAYGDGVFVAGQRYVVINLTDRSVYGRQVRIRPIYLLPLGPRGPPQESRRLTSIRLPPHLGQDRHLCRQDEAGRPRRPLPRERPGRQRSTDRRGPRGLPGQCRILSQQ